MIHRLLNLWRLKFIQDGDVWVEFYVNKKGDVVVTRVGASKRRAS